MRTTVFLSSLNDLILLSCHEILHHDLNIEQSSTARLSYYSALFTFTMCCIEILRIRNRLNEFQGEKFLMLKKKILEFDYEGKIEKEELKFLRKKKESKEIIEEKEKKIESIEEEIDLCERRVAYNFDTITLTMIEGIEEKFLLKKDKRIFYRYFQILKIFITEILISSLQIFPKAQIFLISVTQFIFLIYTIKVVLCRGIFKSFLWSLVIIIDEICVMGFLYLVSLMEFYQREEFSVESWTRTQIFSIYFVLISSLVNITVMGIIFLHNVGWSLLDFIYKEDDLQMKMNRKRVNDIQEIFSEKKIEMDVLNREMDFDVEEEEELRKEESDGELEKMGISGQDFERKYSEVENSVEDLKLPCMKDDDEDRDEKVGKAKNIAYFRGVPVSKKERMFMENLRGKKDKKFSQIPNNRCVPKKNDERNIFHGFHGKKKKEKFPKFYFYS